MPFRPVVTSLLLLALFALVGALVAVEDDAAVRTNLPRYNEAGQLLRPEGYETWVFVGASIGLSYSEEAPSREGPGLFHHVYLESYAYDHFVATGEFPDKTMLILELHSPGQKVSPSNHGYFEGKRVAVEVALKDEEMFEEGWAYFDFSGGKQAASPFPKERCYSCHVDHAKTDNVFTQFYPVLRRRIEDQGKAAGAAAP